MPTLASFTVVPATPFEPGTLAVLREKLASFPVYEVPGDDLFVVFGTLEERRETVALYSRKTAPTFDVECFVQLRPQKLLVHPGDGGGIGHLREFVIWVLAQGPHRLIRGGKELHLDEVLPPIGDLHL